MERRRRGIIQLLEETDRLRTFRGGICRGDPEILSPIKRISGGFGGVALTITCKIDTVCFFSLIIDLIYPRKKEEKYTGKAALTVGVLLIACLKGGSWQIALLFLSKKGLLQEVDFKLHIKMINCCGKHTLEWCERG